MFWHLVNRMPGEEKPISRKVIFFTALIVVLVLMNGCASKKTKLTAVDNNGQVDLRVGDSFVVELDGNPSTGYTWTAKDLDTSMFQQVGDPEFESSNPGLIGSGGSLTLTFKTLKAGTTALTLVYHRPWEMDVKPQDTFTVSVVVK
jgi:inhibitor of cysteine peptidase